MSIKIEPDDNEDPHDAARTAAELSKAYTDLTAGLGSVLSAAAMQPVLDHFRNTIGIRDATAEIVRGLNATYDAPNLLDQVPAALRPDRTPPPLDFIDVRSPSAEIAASTAEVAELLHRQHEAIAQLVALTATNLQHTEAQRESSKRTERFTRRMSWTSLAVAIASLAAAIGAIVVSLATGNI